MPNIKKVTIDAKTIKGLQVRTKNTDEMNSETQKIAPLWEKFYEEVMPRLESSTALYGVYFNYESDAFAAYDLLVGSDALEEDEHFKTVNIEAGRYLVFPVRGELPQSMIDTWERVWAYFDDPSIDERRAFETDFELYKTSTEAEIYIGVHYF